MLQLFRRPSLGTLTAMALMATSALWTSGVSAADVKVEGVHLCCGKCVKAASQSLANVAGVSAVDVNKDDETVSFTAADAAAVERGLTALADSGFYGKTSVPGPDFKVDANRTGNEIQITKLHLCCGGCVKAAESALKDVTGVKSVSSQAKQGTITVTGEKINYAAALKALHETGMHGHFE